MLRPIPYAQTGTEAERLRTLFTGWCRDHSYEAASETLERVWDRMITFYDFPKEHWQHLQTTNPVESPFAALRLRTDAAKRYKRVDRAIAVIWKTSIPALNIPMESSLRQRLRMSPPDLYWTGG